MRKAFKNEVGITLIALVVTIIILLILAGITINAIMGEGGLINRAKIAGQKTEEGKQNDIEAVNNLENQAEELINGNSGGPKALAGTTVAKPSGWTSTKVTPIADGNGGTVPLPSGFYYIGGDYNTGLVISDKQDDTMNASGTTMGNQFVWIPVPNEGALTCTFFDENGQPYTDTKEKLEERARTEFNVMMEGTREGLREEFITFFPREDFPNNPPDGWGQGDLAIFPEIPNDATIDDYEDYVNDCLNYFIELTKNEEWPYYLEDYLYENSNHVYELADYADSGAEANSEKYATMKNQVLKYGGFFVGRYETGINGTELRERGNLVDMIVSKKRVSPCNYIVGWNTGLYRNGYFTYGGAEYWSECMCSENESVTSTLIYGCQWDAMCRYIGDSQRTTIEKTGPELTGSVETDVSKNIYDLAGNCSEWTMEWFENQYCVLRGGNFRNLAPIYSRTNGGVGNTEDYMCFRCALYIAERQLLR